MTEAQAEQAGPGRAPGPAGRAGALVQYALLAGPLLSMLDSSIVNVAVAPVARDLHAGPPWACCSSRWPPRWG